MVISGNAYTDPRGINPIRSTARIRCHCGCKTRATHVGTANGIAMMMGCELSVRRWVKQGPIASIRTAQRNRTPTP